MGTNKKNHKFITWIIYINIAIYATCYQIQRPLEPYLVEQLQKQGESVDAAMEYAKLQSFFSVVQTVGSLVSGRLLDRFGIKGGFVLSFAASALSYAILSQAHSMDMLYYSKIPTIFQSGFLCAQAAIAQFTADGPDRAKALGMLTMSYTVGSVLGPTIGGIIGASGDYYFGAKLAVLGSLLSIILIVFCIQEEKPLATTTTSHGKESLFDIYTIILSSVWVLLSAKVISSVANAMNAAIFPLVLKNQFHFSEKALGLTMSISSFLNAIVNGIFLGHLVDLFHGELYRMILCCVMGMTFCSVLQAVFALPVFFQYFPTIGVYSFLIVTFLSTIFQFVLGTTITGESTSLVRNEHKGSLLGLEHALFAAARVGAPQAGVSILMHLSKDGYGVVGVGVVTACIYFIVQILLQCVGSWDKRAADARMVGSVGKSAERKEK
jgi:MFS family permease